MRHEAEQFEFEMDAALYQPIWSNGAWSCRVGDVLTIGGNGNPLVNGEYVVAALGEGGKAQLKKRVAEGEPSVTINITFSR